MLTTNIDSKMFRVLILATFSFAAAKFDAELDAKFRSLPSDEFLEHFNSQNYSWTMAHNEHLENRILACTHVSKNITLPPHDIDLRLYEKLPKNFDAREKWPNCPTIGEIYDQSQCGSCWTFGSATTASDRTCIHTKEVVRLAEEDLECCDCGDFEGVCEGGQASLAFMFWKDKGLVTQSCKPYDIDELRKRECVNHCVNKDVDYNNDKHFGRKVYAVKSKDKAIKAELFHNGPVQASFAVYEDFPKYTSGIYEHKYGKSIGSHSVRVIGYGEEGGVKYWLAANSWGTGWGDQGFFKIKRHQPDNYFESEMCTGLPK